MAADVARFDEVMGVAVASQERTVALQVHMWLALADGRDTDLMGWSVEGAEPLNGLLCHHIAGHAAIWNRDLERARQALAGMIGTGLHGRWASAARADLQAGIAALEGRDDAGAQGWKEAQTSLRDLGARFTLSLSLMDRALLTVDAADASAAAHEARALLQEMGARALEDRLAALLARRSAPIGKPATAIFREGLSVPG